MTNKDIAVRVYTHSEKVESEVRYKESVNDTVYNRVLVFDTETTTDIFQNLTFGSCKIYQYQEGNRLTRMFKDNILTLDGYVMKKEIIFYNENISQRDCDKLEKYCETHKLELLSKSDFVTEIFLKEIWELETLCVGFNLPFDLSRIAVACKTHQRGKYKEYFELILKQDLFTPNIAIRNIDSRKAFIELTKPAKTVGRKRASKGNFLDLRTLVFSLTNQSCGLNKACEIFGINDCKNEIEGHGKITDSYINYNRQDVDLTWKLFTKANAEFKTHPINLAITKSYSPASIGKSYFNVMGIRSISDKQPNFDKNILGKAMTSYYGGRAECHIRKTPTRVLYTDVTSMYPTVFILQNLWNWVIAEQLTVEENTESIKDFAKSITVDKLFDKNIWGKIPALVEIQPNQDILPVRSKYSNKAYQIGVNEITSEQHMYYTLADIIVSKLLTGRTPTIIKGYTIKIGNPQSDLKPVKLKGEIEVDPRNCNFFKTVIEQRAKIRSTMKNNKTNERMDGLQMFLKILANSTSYGIFIELIGKDLDEEKVIDVYGLETFPIKTKKIEEPGKYFNPLIATMITGASRLILGMIETLIRRDNLNYVFCDTDSMAIALKNPDDSDKAKAIVYNFEQLNPYDKNIIGGSILKIEDENYNRETHELQDLYCYAVSSKRYVLYNKKGNDFIIRKKSDHGLGHLKNPANNWIEDVWQYILNADDNQGSIIVPCWWDTVAMGQHTIAKPHTYKLFKEINMDSSYERQVKPYNFISVWYTDESFSELVPISPYVAPVEFNKICDKLIDRKTGRRINYFDLLDDNEESLLKKYGDTADNYMFHSEKKFFTDEGITCTREYKGELHRTKICVGKIIFIGKEVKELEESNLFGLDENSYLQYINSTWSKIKPQMTNINEIFTILKNNGFTKEQIREFTNAESIENKYIIGLFGKTLSVKTCVPITFEQKEVANFDKYCYVPYWNKKTFSVRLLVYSRGEWVFIHKKQYCFLTKNKLVENKGIDTVLNNCEYKDGVFSTEIIDYPEFISHEKCMAVWHLTKEELSTFVFSKKEHIAGRISREAIHRRMQGYIPQKNNIETDSLKIFAKKGQRVFEFKIGDISAYRCRKREGNSNNAEVLINVNGVWYYVPIKENHLIFKCKLLPRPKHVKMTILYHGYLSSDISSYPDYITIEDAVIKWQIPKKTLSALLDSGYFSMKDNKISRLDLVKYLQGQ
jgi:hypothetical protein